MTPWFLEVAPGVVLHTHLLMTMGILCATVGPASLYFYAQRQLYPDWTHRLRSFPYLLIFGTGIALSNTRAILEALGNVPGTFVRTPKFRIEHPSDTWVGKHYRGAFPWLSLGELGLAVYSGYGTYRAVQQGAYLLLPFLLLFTLDFAAVAGLSLYEVCQAVRPTYPHRRTCVRQQRRASKVGCRREGGTPARQRSGSAGSDQGKEPGRQGKGPLRVVLDSRVPDR
jgi:hypothetical protein